MLKKDDVGAAVSAYWDRRAPLFDGAASHVRHEDEWRRVLSAAFGPIEGAKVLDFGTGTGACAIVAAALGHRVTAIDGARGMLEKAGEAARARGLAIRFVEGAIETCPLPPAGFDVVTIRNVLWTVADPAAVLARASTLLRPSGRIVVADALWSRAPADRSTYPDALAQSLPFHAGLTQTRCTALLEAAGFADIRSWQHLFRAQPYPGDVSCFVLSAGPAEQRP